MYAVYLSVVDSCWGDPNGLLSLSKYDWDRGCLQGAVAKDKAGELKDVCCIPLCSRLMLGGSKWPMIDFTKK